MDINKLIEMLKRLFKISAGFTLIELLVVIAILGVLATALLAAIDPIEQIKKANDSKVQGVAVEFDSALVRYYASLSEFPWWTDVDCKAAVSAGAAPGHAFTAAVDLTTALDCITEMVDNGEIKASFKEATVLGKIFLSTDTTGLRPIICYLPTSKMGQADKIATYINNKGTLDTAAAGDTTACKSRGGAKIDCYWCRKE